ncbi:hypothetical protein [Brevibacillus sp. MER 51]|uniref:hypothetical protein n=1 Tax=Brevibacillus sp. MER 51 TaxID=2939560 RepID=UPI00203F09E4|nr:hypothetical protein [Brevibacillus sp. MER 51]MCM3141323.1 hypothetical protein [Brevibacillus sp. MER 51]
MNLVLGVLVGPILGYFLGKYVTVYYRKKDRISRLSHSLYGLQIYIKKIGIRLDNLLSAVNSPGQPNLASSLEKLHDLLLDEPYGVFLDLGGDDLEPFAKKARIQACMIIAEIEDSIIYTNSVPTIQQIILWKRDIFHARAELLKSRNMLN